MDNGAALSTNVSACLRWQTGGKVQGARRSVAAHVWRHLEGAHQGAITASIGVGGGHTALEQRDHIGELADVAHFRLDFGAPGHLVERSGRVVGVGVTVVEAASWAGVDAIPAQPGRRGHRQLRVDLFSHLHQIRLGARLGNRSGAGDAGEQGQGSEYRNLFVHGVVLDLGIGGCPQLRPTDCSASRTRLGDEAKTDESALYSEHL